MTLYLCMLVPLLGIVAMHAWIDVILETVPSEPNDLQSPRGGIETDEGAQGVGPCKLVACNKPTDPSWRSLRRALCFPFFVVATSSPCYTYSVTDQVTMPSVPRAGHSCSVTRHTSGSLVFQRGSSMGEHPDRPQAYDSKSTQVGQDAGSIPARAISSVSGDSRRRLPGSASLHVLCAELPTDGALDRRPFQTFSPTTYAHARAGLGDTGKGLRKDTNPYERKRWSV